MATLTITRPDQLANLVRRYRLIVDGKEVVAIPGGHVVDIELPPGRHRIIAAVNWARSNPIEFELSDDEHIVLEIGSNCAGWQLPLQILYFTIWSDRCLFLKRAGDPTPAISLVPRFSIRGIMIVVACVALLMGDDAYRKGKYRKAMLAAAKQHREKAKQARQELTELLDLARTKPEADLRDRIEDARFEADWEEKLAATILKVSGIQPPK